MEDPNNQPPPESRPMPALKGSRDLFDINILPERFLRKKLALMVLLPWLILLVLLSTIYPIYTLAGRARGSFQESRLDLARAQASLDFYQANSQEKENLQTQIDELLVQKESLIQAYGGLELTSYQWNPTLVRINKQLPDGASWLQISQQGKSIRLDGVVREYQQVINLLDSLIQLEELTDVEIETIEQIGPEDLPESFIDFSLEAPISETGTPVLYTFSIFATTAEEVKP